MRGSHVMSQSVLKYEEKMWELFDLTNLKGITMLLQRIAKKTRLLQERR